MQRSFRLTVLSCTFVTAAGCSSQQMQDMQDKVSEVGKNYGTIALCGAGTVLGATAGYAMKGKQGALVGAAAGATLGCLAGHYWQSRLQEIDRIAKEENLKVKTEQLTLASSATAMAAPKDAGLVTQIEDTGMFDNGSDKLSVNGQRAIDKIAKMFATSGDTDQQAGAKQFSDRRLLVVGHSDATGTAEANQKLSERRAKAVGKVLVKAGILATSIYYQGAGASRPIADNSDPFLRGQNRRVEIVELTNEQALVMRAESETGNTKYLQYGTSATKKPRATEVKAAASDVAVNAPTQTKPAAKNVASSSTVKVAPKIKPAVDFAGQPVSSYSWSMAQSIQPKNSGFELISTAQANEMPMSSCEADMPRNSGEVLSMADDKPLIRHATKDYMPGYNNRVWASIVNGHLVTVSPVSILRENAQVDRQPLLQVVKNYDDNHKNKAQSIKALANTYEGESQVLYRVFAQDTKATVSCMDIVFSKGNAQVNEGALFYMAGAEAYVASYKPVPATK